ncbi:MAG: peptide deformylase [Candidatus Omnitrophica bacterium]|nr:peptide deformylase [Candidatus Omnitrophota bacterium]
MAVLSVIKYPHKVLQTKTAPVVHITDTERKLVKDMIDTMYAENGVGLAANQVGVSQRIFVASPDQVKGRELVFFNPRIVKQEGAIKEFEGCLSIPEFYEPVRRAKKVWMRATNMKGETVEVKGEGLLSRIFQHEIDHLNGILFIDRLGFLKSKTARKKLSKKG